MRMREIGKSSIGNKLLDMQSRGLINPTRVSHAVVELHVEIAGNRTRNTF